MRGRRWPTMACRSSASRRKVYDGWKYPGRLGRRGLRAGGPEDPEARRLLLHGAGRRRHRRSADRAHDRRRRARSRSTARGRTRPTTRSSARSPATERWWSKGHGTLVEGRDRPLVHGLSRLRERLSTRSAGRRCSSRSSGPTMAGSGRRGAIRRSRSRSLPARRLAARLGVLGRFLDATAWACSGASTTAIERRPRALSLRERRAGAEGARAPVPPTARRCGSSTATRPTRSKSRSTPTRGASAGLLLFYSSRLYAGLGFSAKNFFMHSYGLDRPQAKPRRRRASSSASACATTVTSSRCITARMARRGRVRPRDGTVGLSPQRGLRFPEPAPGSLRRRHRRGAVPRVQIPRCPRKAQKAKRQKANRRRI